MKSILKKALAGIVIAALLGGFGGLNAGAEEANPAPADLLSEAYNPFYGMEFPDGYTMRRFVYDQGDHTCHLYIDAEDSGENVAAVMLHMLGYEDPDDIGRCADSLQNAGAVGIETFSADTGAAVSCEIEDYERDGNCSIDLYQTMRDGSAYDSFIAANFNPEALGAAAEYLDIAQAGQAVFEISLEDNFAVSTYTFSFPNAKEIKAELVDIFQNDYCDDGDFLEIRYGDLYTDVRFESAADGLIYLQQHMDATDLCFGRYVPPITLRNLGFGDGREDNARCGFDDKKNGVYILISKSEWGENENEDERNAIRFMKDIGEDGYMLTYYPAEDTADIRIEFDTEQARYTCRLTDSGYIYMTDGALSDAKKNARLLFPDSDNALHEALAAFEAYIGETFGMTPEELYAVEYE